MTGEDRIGDLVAMTEHLADNPTDTEKRAAWTAAVRKMDAMDLADVASRLTSNADHRPARIKALREGILAEVDRKSAERVVLTLHHLDKAATKLTWASFFLAAVGTVLAAIQVWQGFK